MKKKISFIISINNDWNKLKKNEKLVDISNNAYFGFRAMEKESISIIYDPTVIDNLVRICKESKKYPKTKHILILNSSTLGFESNNYMELF
ncbi:MAG: hypothetical protein HRS50_01985, partial [Mycoplasmataceae bacterium]|nr:hypothetical protein [Mycoplasmataceae bacterium]